MYKTIKEIWDYLENLNVSKLYISYKAKKKFNSELNIKIENTIVTCKQANDSKITWDSDLFKDDSFLIYPIRKEHISLNGKADGLLVYDNANRKIILKGKYQKKIIEDYKITIDENDLKS